MSLASVGHDGAVCTWNVVARPSGTSGVSACGKRASFSNVLISGPQSEQYQHGMAVNVLDAVFSPDGASLAVADTVSRRTPASLFIGRFFRVSFGYLYANPVFVRELITPEKNPLDPGRPSVPNRLPRFPIRIGAQCRARLPPWYSARAHAYTCTHIHTHFVDGCIDCIAVAWVVHFRSVSSRRVPKQSLAHVSRIVDSTL